MRALPLKQDHAGRLSHRPPSSGTGTTLRKRSGTKEGFMSKPGRDWAALSRTGSRDRRPVSGSWWKM